MDTAAHPQTAGEEQAQEAEETQEAEEARSPAEERQPPGQHRSPGRHPRRLREIDFSRPTKFSQDQQRRVAREHEDFCRSAATQLSAELRHPIHLELLHVSQLTWLSALADIPQPSIYAVLGVKPLGTRMLLSAELGMLRRLIARLLGGIDGDREQRQALTEIELALARRLLGSLVAPLSLTWMDLLGVELELEDLEAQHQSIQLAPPSEPSLVVTVELREGDSSSTLSLLVPYRAIEPVAGRLQGSLHYGGPISAADPEGAAMLRAALSAVEVEVRAEVASVETSIGDLLALRQGDLVRLGACPEAGVALLVGERLVYRGRPGRVGRRRAVLVLPRGER